MKYLLFLTFIFCKSAMSGEKLESKEKLVEEVINASQFSEFSDITRIVYMKAVTMNVTPETTQEEYERISSKVRQNVQSAASDFYGQHEIKDQLKAIYLESFSDEELEQLAQFYESELGQRFMQAYPLINDMKSEIRNQKSEIRNQTRVC